MVPLVDAPVVRGSQGVASWTSFTSDSPSSFSLSRPVSSGCARAFDPEVIMSALYLIGGVVSLGLLVYLFVALLKPEALS
jgi:K+-transporting ATPase KdpF subunit